MPYLPKKSADRPWVTPREAHSGRKRSNSDFYNSTAWRKARASYLFNRPLCAICYQEGEFVGAKVVDHIVPINEGGAKLDPDNFQGLCNMHHNQKSGREGAAVTNAQRKSA